MPTISVFEMLKVGIGPSSSHTLGPWRAVQQFLRELPRATEIVGLRFDLYGSLALTGKGHYSDKAISLALLGYDPEDIDVDAVPSFLARLEGERTLRLVVAPSSDPAVPAPSVTVPFDPVRDIVFNADTRLPFHANALRCTAYYPADRHSVVYYSVGGGFVVREGGEEFENDAEAPPSGADRIPFPCETAADIRRHTARHGLSIADMVWANETRQRSEAAVRAGLRRLRDVMVQSVFRGCRSPGILPGGLGVGRRAPRMHRKLMARIHGDGVRSVDAESVHGDTAHQLHHDADTWLRDIRARHWSFEEVLQWVACFALAVNEENAAMGRVVTAPTNGAAGVIPAVLLYHYCFGTSPVSEADLDRFLLVAGDLAALFKKRATISAAMGGCQAEIGVSSAMAAGALTEARGGTVEQSLMAAEIAMEHHLGLTCDPVAGLVQVPCIERNSMGAVKAINASLLALEGDPSAAKVSLDHVIQTMWETAQDMHGKYKETSQGGLAVNIPVNVSEC